MIHTKLKSTKYPEHLHGRTDSAFGRRPLTPAFQNLGRLCRNAISCFTSANYLCQLIGLYGTKHSRSARKQHFKQFFPSNSNICNIIHST